MTQRSGKATALKSVKRHVFINGILDTLNTLECKQMAWLQKCDRSGNGACCRFMYQAIQFELLMDEASRSYRLTLPRMLRKEAEELPLLSMVCNEINMQRHSPKCVLKYDADSNGYDFNLSYEMVGGSDEELRATLESHLHSLSEAMFALIHQYEQLKYWYGTEDPAEQRSGVYRQYAMRMAHLREDMDTDEYAQAENESFCGFEAKANAGKKHAGKDTFRYSLKDVMAYSPMIKQMLPFIAPMWRLKDLAYMKILCDEYTYVDDTEDIAWQPLLAPMVDGRGKKAEVRMEECTYVLGDKNNKTLVMHVQYKGQNKHHIIFRLTVLSDEQEIHQGSHNLGKGIAQTMLIGIDKMEEEQRKAEFQYMCDDAEEKRWASLEQEMTAAQRISLLSDDKEVKELLYFGTRDFEHGRFPQALISLKRVYRKLGPIYDKLTRRQNVSYLECLYMIGYSLNDLGQYEQACYYLRQIPSDLDVRYDEELLYSYAHLNDHYLISYLEERRASIRRFLHWDEDEVPESYKNHYARILCLLVESYIDDKKYDKAEEMLKEEIEESRNVAYAESALMRIRSEKKLASKVNKNT